MIPAITCWTVAFWFAVFGNVPVADFMMLVGIGFMELNLYGRGLACNDDN